jgi:hypothetical protein
MLQHTTETALYATLGNGARAVALGLRMAGHTTDNGNLGAMLADLERIAEALLARGKPTPAELQPSSAPATKGKRTTPTPVVATPATPAVALAPVQPAAPPAPAPTPAPVPLCKACKGRGKLFGRVCKCQVPASTPAPAVAAPAPVALAPAPVVATPTNTATRPTHEIKASDMGAYEQGDEMCSDKRCLQWVVKGTDRCPRHTLRGGTATGPVQVPTAPKATTPKPAPAPVAAPKPAPAPVAAPKPAPAPVAARTTSTPANVKAEVGKALAEGTLKALATACVLVGATASKDGAAMRGALVQWLVDGTVANQVAPAAPAAPAPKPSTATPATPKPSTPKPTPKGNGKLSGRMVATLKALIKLGTASHDQVAELTGRPKGNLLRELTAEGLVDTGKDEDSGKYAYTITAKGRKALAA